MSRYDGLIIPRSYSEYINKTDAATLLQALQLSGVMDAAPTENSNHPAKSGGVYESLLSKVSIQPQPSSPMANINALTVNTIGTYYNNSTPGNITRPSLESYYWVYAYIGNETRKAIIMTAAGITNGTIYINRYASGAWGSWEKIDNEKYTTGEQQIGVWIDGSPIYRKTINCGALLNAETLFVAHGITGLDKIVRLYGYTTNGQNKFILPHVSPEQLIYQINLYVTGNYISITPGNDRTAYTTTYVTIEYTKTN